MKSLKLFRTIIIIIVAVTLSLIYPDLSYAENASVCQGYANGAINAFQRSQSLGCAFSGPRWQSVYDNHYNLCLSALPEAVQNEDRLRSAMLSTCAKEPNGLFCDNYARTAVQQNAEFCSNIGGSCVADFVRGIHCCQHAGAPALCVYGSCKACIPHGEEVPPRGTQICCSAKDGDVPVLDQFSEKVVCGIPG